MVFPTGWIEEVGDWSLVDDTLQSDLTADAQVIYQFPPTSGDVISFKVTGNTYSEVAGDVYRIIVNWEDEDNYSYGEFVVGVGGHIRLVTVSGGAHDQLGLVATDVVEDNDGGIGITVCFTEKVFYIGISGRAEEELWILDPTVHEDGFLAGLGSDGTASAFDSFIWYEHYITNNNCPSCVCHCNQQPLPMTLNIELSYPDNQVLSPCLDGINTTLSYSVVDSAWVGSIQADLDGCDCSDLQDEGEGFTAEFSFICSDNPAEPVGGFNLDVDGSHGDELATGNMTNGGDSDGATCDPLRINFGGPGPGCEPPPGGGPGTFTWIVTV